MNLYERLGLPNSASADEVRFAYRRLARVHHPDAPGGDAEEMAKINEAWRTLSDPGRRAMYDASLRPKARATESQRLAEERYPVAPRPVTREGPQRFPIGWMIIGAIGVIILVVAAGNVVGGSKTTRATYQRIEAGSCVRILENLDVSEVDCAAPHDGVAVSIVDFDHHCPADLETHRDRQGLGQVCMKRTKQTPTT